MQPDQPVKILVVEDSNSVRMMLVHILTSDPNVQVIGTANNGIEALDFIENHTPDVILMDIHMPEMDGFDATRIIMETRPVPIVICSGSHNTREDATTFRLMEAGAVAFVEKPFGPDHPDFQARCERLVQTVKLMSEVKVVRRWAKLRNGAPRPSAAAPRGPIALAPGRVVGIGASTGGPPVLQTILSALPRDFPLPLLIVQHIAAGFLPGLAEWLDLTTGIRTHIASHGQEPLPGHVYLAPDDFHLTLAPNGMLALNRNEPQNGLRPSVDPLFVSIAKCQGGRGIGILLTGMGKDGAKGLREIHDAGGFTIAQDRETSIVHGMPGTAIEMGAASQVLPANRIAGALCAFVETEISSDRGII